MKKHNLNLISGITIFFCLVVSISQGQDYNIAELDGVTIEYYDSGTDKTPLVFIHGDSRDGRQYDAFIYNFKDTHRIVTYSRRGYGNSISETKSQGVPTDVNDLLKLLNFLKIEKAVFIGNSYAGRMMTYLAENHTDRNIGQIYLAGNPGNFKEIIQNDPLNSYKMMLWAQGGEEYANQIVEFSTYQHDYITKGTQIPNIPALTFLNANNTRGMENMNFILLYASAPERIKYETPKQFFQNVSSDPEIKAQVESYHENTVKPILIANVETWIESFSSLKIVNLDIRGVSGYEFERSPELITSHIKEFLADLKE